MRKLLIAVLTLAALAFAGQALACDCAKNAKAAEAAKADPAATAAAEPCPYAKDGAKGDCANCDKPCPYMAAKAEAAKAADSAATAPKVFSAAQKEGTKATCPVMGGTFAIAKDTLHSEYKGKHVYFCCPGCKEKFDKDPEKFLK